MAPSCLIPLCEPGIGIYEFISSWIHPIRSDSFFYFTLLSIHTCLLKTETYTLLLFLNNVQCSPQLLKCLFFLPSADATPSPSSSVSEGLDMFPDSPLHSNTGFQLSPDFRPRASSNASSCGRLSPIPFSESEWNSPTSYPSSKSWWICCVFIRLRGHRTRLTVLWSVISGYVSEQLAGSLAEDMKLHHEAFITGGFTNSGGPPPPPPPYQAPFDGFGARIGHAPTPYGISHCPVHRVQGCSCALSQCAGEVSNVKFSARKTHDRPTTVDKSLLFNFTESFTSRFITVVSSK